MLSEKELQIFKNTSRSITEELAKDVVGHSDVIEHVLIAMIAGGNVLLEGVPGIGKTRLVRSIGRVFGLPFSRIQFTPDLMPTDVTGTNILEKTPDGQAVYKFQPGPIFSSIVLADEINRATPKTQSALLEAMEEHRVSVAGVDHFLREPFFVLATQNPIEQDGTYTLPEAQIDRFMMKLVMEFPSVDQLCSIINMTQVTKQETASQVLNAATLLQMCATASEIPVMEEVTRYAMRLVAATHADSEAGGETARTYLRLGASPRAGQALISAAKVRALLNGRYNVSYDDINNLAYPVLRHRIRLNIEALTAHKTEDELVAAIIREQGETHTGRRMWKR